MINNEVKSCPHFKAMQIKALMCVSSLRLNGVCELITVSMAPRSVCFAVIALPPTMSRWKDWDSLRAGDSLYSRPCWGWTHMESNHLIFAFSCPEKSYLFRDQIVNKNAFASWHNTDIEGQRWQIELFLLNQIFLIRPCTFG